MRTSGLLRTLALGELGVYDSPSALATIVYLCRSYAMRRVILASLLIFASAASAQEEASQYRLAMIGHAHIDLAYRWRWNEVVKHVAPDTFRGILAMMEREPGLTFAQSQMALYEAMQEEQPELFNEIRRRILEGRWAVVGGMWSEADMISPSGESFVRQFLIGKDYARRQLGVDVKVGWLPDAFAGMAGTLPQILKGCGIDYCVLDTRHSPQEVFWWEGPAGSSVIAYPVFVAYNLPPLSPAILPSVLEWGARNPGLRSILVLYGRGDHGGGPRSDDLHGMKALEQRPGAPKIIYQTPQQYFDTEIRPHKDALPVHAGSLPGMIRLSYSSQARVRMANRAAENLLLTAEMFNTLGTLCQRKPSYPREDFTSAWKLVLRGQFHDALRGTATGRATDDAVADFGQAEREARALLSQGLQYIGSRIDTSGTGIPLIIYNASSWRRTGAVEVDVRLPEPATSLAVRDASGTDVLYQKTGPSEDPHKLRLLVLARDVPAVGFGTLRLHIGARSIASTPLRASASTLENEYLRVSADDSGAITSILDKRTGREVLAGTGIRPELLREDPVASSAWNLALTGEHAPLTAVSKAELVGSGPVRAVLRSHYRSQDSNITVDAILDAGIPRLEFELRADWHDRDKFLVIGFPTQIKHGDFTVEKPYGFEEVPTNGQRQCAGRWVDLSAEDFGLSLLNDGLDEFWVQDGVIRMGVLRGARDMDPRMDEGPHLFRYAIYPHSGGWRGAGTVQQAVDLNQPLVAVQEPHHSGNISPSADPRGNFVLPPVYSFLSVAPENIAVSVIKIQQEAWMPESLVVRLHETEGRATKGKLTVPLPFLRAEETNLIEEPITALPTGPGMDVALNFQPGEIKTIRLVLLPAGIE